MNRYGVTTRKRGSMYTPFIDREEPHGDEGQELEEEHGEEAGPKKR
jgi:hypothetical protein